MKKIIVFLILIGFVLGLAGTAMPAGINQVVPTAEEVKAVPAAEKDLAANAEQKKKSINPVDNLAEDIKDGIVSGVFTVFIYVTAIIARTFDVLFKFITKYIFYLIDFSNKSLYPQGYKDVITTLTHLVYVITIGFLFIFFVYNLTSYFWRGEDLSKPMLGIAFALTLIVFYPFIYSLMFKVFYSISMWAQEAAIKAHGANGNANIFSSMMNISSFVGIKEGTDLKISSLFNQAETTTVDLAYIQAIVAVHLKNNDYYFFIKYVLIFIISVMGIIATIEVMFLKGAQIINLFIAYFTGIFAASMVVMEETRATFWDWFRKTAQIMAYNLFWAMIIVGINLFAVLINKASTLPGSIVGDPQIFSMLCLVVVFAGIKMMGKVGGISEGLMMSQRVMENFGSAMKMDAVIATFGAGKVINSFMRATKGARDAIGGKLLAGAGAAAGAIMNAPGNVSAAARAASQTVKDYSSQGGVGGKAQAAIQAMKGFDPRSMSGMKTSLGVAGGHVKDVTSTFGKNFNGFKQDAAMKSNVRSGNISGNQYQKHMDTRYAKNFGNNLDKNIGRTNIG